MDNFRIIPVGALAVNCYLYFHADQKLLFIVDPGDDADLIISAAENYAFERAVILLTHAHVDHIGAVPEIARQLNVEFIYLNSGDVELYYSPDNHILPYLPPVANLPPVTSSWQLDYPQCIATPGHSPGGSCFYFPDQKLLISGDTLFAGSVGRTDLPGGSFATLEKSIREKLLTLPDDVTVYPGHGPRTSIKAEKCTNPYLT
ncbi:MAG: MBL fold metallo-hydrolase [Lentisphaerae bacterium]|nr:MBL fold metallo-hydrolase [Lentisphaerota bacterium]